MPYARLTSISVKPPWISLTTSFLAQVVPPPKPTPGNLQKRSLLARILSIAGQAHRPQTSSLRIKTPYRDSHVICSSCIQNTCGQVKCVLRPDCIPVTPYQPAVDENQCSVVIGCIGDMQPDGNIHI